MKKYVVYSEKMLSPGKYGKEKRVGGFNTYEEARVFLEELRGYEQHDPTSENDKKRFFFKEKKR